MEPEHAEQSVMTLGRAGLAGRLGRLIAWAVGLALVVACGASPSSPSGSPGGGSPGSASPAPSPSGPLTKLVVGLGFIPNVQFAQFYLAQQAGYYRDVGLEVILQNKIDPDLIALIGQGAVDIGIADGTSVIPAVSQGIPVRYVATIYAQFPSIVFAKASSGIKTVADLDGRKLGIPGRFGSSWIMLQALLGSANLSPSDLEIIPYPDFSQAVAVRQGAVDAATGFVNNEPVQLELSGEKVVILRVDQIVPLPGNGLITGVGALESKAGVLRAFVAATLRAMREIEADPEKGLDAAIATIPELGKDRPTALAVLKATIAVWQSEYTRANGLGAIDQAAWGKSIEFLSRLPDKLVPNPVRAEGLISTALLPPK